MQQTLLREPARGGTRTVWFDRHDGEVAHNPPLGPFARIGLTLGAVGRYRKTARELDHLLDLPDRIFSDIGVPRDEVARVRRQLRVRTFLPGATAAARRGGQG